MASPASKCHGQPQECMPGDSRSSREQGLGQKEARNDGLLGDMGYLVWEDSGYLNANAGRVAMGKKNPSDRNSAGEGHSI